jgi:hypothetical protein
MLFLLNYFLFKSCTAMKTPFADGHLGVFGGGFPQSYPQILWIRKFHLSNSVLSPKSEVKSSFSQQASEQP